METLKQGIMEQDGFSTQQPNFISALMTLEPPQLIVSSRALLFGMITLTHTLFLLNTCGVILVRNELKNLLFDSCFNGSLSL